PAPAPAMPGVSGVERRPRRCWCGLLRCRSTRRRVRWRMRDPRAPAIMTPDQLERLLNRLPDVKSTDELYDLELRLAPFDEEDAVGKRALYHLASARCQLARGPALPFERFTLTCPEPPVAQDRFEVRGRVGSRITRIAWVDGVLCGSLYVIAMLGGDA